MCRNAECPFRRGNDGHSCGPGCDQNGRISLVKRCAAKTHSGFDRWAQEAR
jgi:hypothetical protein